MSGRGPKGRKPFKGEMGPIVAESIGPLTTPPIGPLTGKPIGVDDTRGLAAIAKEAYLDTYQSHRRAPRQDAAKIRADHKKLQLEVIKMHLARSKPDAIANRFGIAEFEAVAIVKAFKAFLSKKAY